MADWKNNLNSFFDGTEKMTGAEERSELGVFIDAVVLPAFDEAAAEMSKHGRHVTIRSSESSAVIMINHKGEEELSYRIQGRTFPTKILPYAEVRFRERNGLRRISVESMIRSGSSDYAMADISTDEIVQDLVKHYTQRVK